MRLALALPVLALMGASSCRSDSNNTSSSDNPAIYNEDNRLDWYQSSSNTTLQRMARSTLVMTSKSKVSGANSFSGQSQPLQLRGDSFAQSYNLCQSERFREQPIVGNCSVFLIGTDTVATAGHCITSQADCETKAFILDFMYDSPTSNPLRTSSDKVFSCKRLVTRAQNALGADYAVVQLDRPVANRQPMVFNTKNDINPGAKVALLGYPSGLPLKIAAGGTVRSSVDRNFFVTDLDAFGGNSGSPVVNLTTGLVEGILVRGVEDFVDQGNCKVSKVCRGNSCSGEEVTKSSVVSAALIAAQNASQPGGNGSSGGNGSGNGNVGSIGSVRSLFQSLNARLRNCTLSVGSGGIKATNASDEYVISIAVTTADDQKTTTTDVSVDTKSVNSAVYSILNSLLAGTVNRCFLNP